MTSKILLAFDFDHTVIDDNSDLYIKKLAPNGIPEAIEDTYSDQGWNEYMAAIFAHLHDLGVTEDELLSCVREIPFTDGMKELLQYAKEKGHECIIVSDANSTFIQNIMSHYGLDDTMSAVYTNPAHFDKDGKLKIRYYHTQDWCDLSTVNLCKGHILEEHLKQRDKEGIQYRAIFYIGDGSNDLCPSLRLKETDFVFARVNFRLWKKIRKLKEEEEKGVNKLVLKAKFVEWETGFDVIKVLQKLDEEST
ncbi:hypothetical protein FSP39_000716 [Pinctada imbricata]|uniref:Uncharacterized protein n=1 Tax=Pinctada imbricata TaxID=66713 RepID=A0AA88YG02_PINIB|nr:hypothetical protein FSP39_000716 [Pinctada imbricata]